LPYVLTVFRDGPLGKTEGNATAPSLLYLELWLCLSAMHVFDMFLRKVQSIFSEVKT
jgi:hypothetical protein